MPVLKKTLLVVAQIKICYSKVMLKSLGNRIIEVIRNVESLI